MANNYTLFSMEIGVTPDQATWLTEVFGFLDGEGASPDGFDVEALDDQFAPCTLDLEGDTAYFYSEESGDINALAAVLQQFLEHFNITEGVGLEAAFTCSKPRPGEFGGAAAWITKDDIEWMSTGGWLSAKVAAT